jgi:uncharacterized protein YciI
MDDEWVTIIHPETGGTGEVHRASLPQHYASGWRLLADGEVPPAEPGTEPPPMTKAQAAKAAKAAEQAASAETEEN